MGTNITGKGTYLLNELVIKNCHGVMGEWYVKWVKVVYSNCKFLSKVDLTL